MQPSQYTYDSYSFVYPLIIVFGVILSVMIMWFFWKKQKYTNYHFFILIPILCVLGIYGARWWYLAFNPSDFNGPMDIINPFTGGRSILGAIFFVYWGIFFYVKYFASTEILFSKAIDIILPNLLLAQAIGRWGNFYNQEVYGAAMSQESISWLPTFIQEQMYIDGAYRQPLFLYESISTMFCWVILIFVIRKFSYFKDGTLGSLYIIFYAIIRSSMELYRDPEFIMNIKGVPTSFILSLMFIPWGIGNYVWFNHYKKT